MGLWLAQTLMLLSRGVARVVRTRMRMKQSSLTKAAGIVAFLTSYETHSGDGPWRYLRDGCLPYGAYHPIAYPCNSRLCSHHYVHSCVFSHT